jgi:hypothetical protein
LSGICNAAQNMRQFTIVQIKHKSESILFFVELQIQKSSKRHYKCRLAGVTPFVKVNPFFYVGFSQDLVRADPRFTCTLLKIKTTLS